MAQIAQVLKGDPGTVAGLLTTLAVSNEIVLIRKTFSAGEYIIVYDNSGTAGQTISVIKGDPITAATLINALISGSTKVALSDTFSAGSYLVAYD